MKTVEKLKRPIHGVVMRYLIIITLCSAAISFAQVSVADVISEIHTDSVASKVNHLQSYQTRFLLSEKRFEAANWIKKQFEGMGFHTVEFDTFECRTRIGAPYFNRQIDTTTLQMNVIATLQGSTSPDEIYIICGHYDSFSRNSNPFVEAPGADDNASGTTAVLESARAIMKSGFKPTYTIRFIAFAAEELMNFGDGGSRIYAAKCKANGDNILMVINNDMIGYCESNFFAAKANIGHPDTFPNFDKVMAIAEQFSGIGFNSEGYFGADLKGFLDNGYTGLYMEEAAFNTINYHTNTDLAINVNFDFMTEVIKAATAILISGNEIITDVKTNEQPTDYAVLQNYPNPFNPTTTIEYAIPAVGLDNYPTVNLKIHDTLGRQVAILIDKSQNAGTYKIDFNAAGLASGVYYLVLKIDNEISTRKMLLLK